VRTQLAVKAGCSPSLITWIENWDYTPTLPIRGRLARALHVHVDQIGWAPTPRTGLGLNLAEEEPVAS
jgi:DNA-binding XRE family transcriptional regulator